MMMNRDLALVWYWLLDCHVFLDTHLFLGLVTWKLDGFGSVFHKRADNQASGASGRVLADAMIGIDLVYTIG